MNLPITIGEWTICEPGVAEFFGGLAASSHHGILIVLKNGEVFLNSNDPIPVVIEWNKSDAKKFLQTYKTLTNKNSHWFEKEIDFKAISHVTSTPFTKLFTLKK